MCCMGASTNFLRFVFNWTTVACGGGRLTAPAAFDQTVQTLLVDGTPETLPPNLITFFNERRIEARQIAPWVERHFRPGKAMGE